MSRTQKPGPNKCPVFGEKFILNTQARVSAHVRFLRWTKGKEGFFNERLGLIKRPVGISAHPKAFISN